MENRNAGEPMTMTAYDEVEVPKEWGATYEGAPTLGNWAPRLNEIARRALASARASGADERAFREALSTFFREWDRLSDDDTEAGDGGVRYSVGRFFQMLVEASGLGLSFDRLWSEACLGLIAVDPRRTDDMATELARRLGTDGAGLLAEVARLSEHVRDRLLTEQHCRLPGFGSFQARRVDEIAGLSPTRPVDRVRALREGRALARPRWVRVKFQPEIEDDDYDDGRPKAELSEEERRLGRLAAAIVEEAKQGPLRVPGLGTWVVVTYPGYNGRNPRTGEVVVVPAKQRPDFLADPSLEIVTHDGANAENTRARHEA
jgi:nucleoid DNA-binding protein